MIRVLTVDARHRWSVLFRVLAAAVGGYALTSALAVVLGLALPVERAQAVNLAMDSGFVIYLPILLWVFHTRSAARAWGWLALWNGAAMLLAWWLMQGGAG